MLGVGKARIQSQCFAWLAVRLPTYIYFGGISHYFTDFLLAEPVPSNHAHPPNTHTQMSLVLRGTIVERERKEREKIKARLAETNPAR